MVKKGVGADSSHIKGLGFCANGTNANYAVIDVKNGKVLRTRSFNYAENYTPEQLNAWTININGKKLQAPMKSVLPPFSIAYRNRVTSKNRILYPMKRVDWNPENRNPQNRGKSKFKRITWDEALDIMESEIRRQYNTYGPGSILAQADGHGESKGTHAAHGTMVKLLGDCLGGFTMQMRQPDSWEGWFWGAEHIWDQYPTGQGNNRNLLIDICKNTKMLLCWGCDPETTPWGWGGQWASILSYYFSEIGIEQIYICPDLNYGAAVHADKWIPVLPNTDLALQFAIAYVWLTEGTYDQEYLDTHSIGFDWLKYEIMGGTSGEPRTPEWAESICGVPARIIKALARKWAKCATTIAHANGGSYIRSAYSHEPGRMEVCLLAMQGLGKPGANQFKFFEWGLFNSDDTRAMPVCESPLPCYGGYNGVGHADYERCIPKTLIPEGILNGPGDEPLTWRGVPDVSVHKELQFVHRRFPAHDDDPYLHMIWSDSPCWSTCWNGGNEFVKALRSENLEFIVVQHPWLENDSLFADLLLPVSTKFEEYDCTSEHDQGTPNTMFLETPCFNALGESMSDWDITCAVADRLGVGEQYRGTHTDEFTCARLTFEASGAGNYISWEDFQKQEYVCSPFIKDWEEIPSGFYPFYSDPEANPLQTMSGKLEIYSNALAANFPDDIERMPYPHYIDEGPTHSESARSPRFAQYPFRIVSNHPRWRVHAQFDDIPWLRELSKVTGEDGYGYEPVWINPKDAAEYGIEDGDVVKIYNERDWVLGGAVVTERIIPGAISQEHGARLDPCEAGISDRGGANNLIAPKNITSHNCAGEVTSGYLVGIEKVDLNELAEQFPETFNREYNPAEGPSINNWIVE